ncbi:N-alpha-acetyltransferase, non-catalitic subunit [Coemansia erecta]|nr:N-alpha-acetyltransferase, non-catalitic subunit [Coemansia sp. RSA 2618]KAJ2825134.1 N-alpha-acetyltransferase, non-catalitic subunit [Coemansia erecta]
MADSEQLSSGLSGLSLENEAHEGQQLEDVQQQLESEAWLDITTLVDAAAGELGSGEMIKPDYFTLFDAMTSIEVMDARLDMGMMSAADAEEAAQWDIDRVLTLREALWIVLRLVRCEMTWHQSASLLQTLYTCNYFTADIAALPIGSAQSANPVRDVVLMPIVVATGVGCRLVWSEYVRENLFGEEDVQLGTIEPQLFNACSQRDAETLLDAAQTYLEGVAGEPGARELLDAVEMRRHWLRALACLSAGRIELDAAGATAAGLAELREMRVEWPRDEGTHVRGVFDAKCMRRYAAAAPIKPRDLISGEAAVSELTRIAADLQLVAELSRIESVEHLVYFFETVQARVPAPFVRSLLMTVLAHDNCVLLREPPDAFVRRAVLEVTAAPARALEGLMGTGDAARVLLDWFRTLAQNAPRARRVALKYLGSWDALQGEAEQADIAAFTGLYPGRDASDVTRNPFWVSSWAYHMKLLLLEGALLAGLRLCVYAPYEYAMVFCYVTQVFEAHTVHIDRMSMGVAGTAAAARTARLCRWGVLIGAQHNVAVAQWLLAHACDRMLVFRAPWHTRRSDADSLRARARQDAEPAQRARYALRFRAMSNLGSPTHLSFDGWQASCAQLDECPLHELFDHAQAALASARTSLDGARAPTDDTAHDVVAAWSDACRGLYRVVVANLVALAKLQQSGVLHRFKELSVTGAAALQNRQCALQADIDDVSDRPVVHTKKQRKEIERARKWRDAVVALTTDKLRISCAPGPHPDWPIYAFETL